MNGVILAKLTDAGKEFHLFITLLQKKYYEYHEFICRTTATTMTPD